MRVHLLSLGTHLDEDMDVAEMLRGEGHVLVDNPEHAEAIFLWNKGTIPLYVCTTGPATTPTLVYSLHAMRVFLREHEQTGKPGRNTGSRA